MEYRPAARRAPGNAGAVRLEPLRHRMLQADDPKRLRNCAARHCVLRFYDVSRAGRRRWCSMSLCGDRAKVRADYRRRAGEA